MSKDNKRSTSYKSTLNFLQSTLGTSKYSIQCVVLSFCNTNSYYSSYTSGKYTGSLENLGFRLVYNFVKYYAYIEYKKIILFWDNGLKAKKMIHRDVEQIDHFKKCVDTYIYIELETPEQLESYLSENNI